MSAQPIIISDGGRPFAASAVALQGIIIDERERILLLHAPDPDRGWQVVSGGLEAGETVLAGTQREIAEEVGAAVEVRPLGVVHSQTFHYDESVPFMIGIYYLFAYQGGDVAPGDDMVGSDFRWWSLAELAQNDISFHPSTHLWLLRRAVELYRLWRDRPLLPLQPGLDNEQ